MQYQTEAVRLLEEAIRYLEALDVLSEGRVAHRLDSMEVLRKRLEAICQELRTEGRLGPAIARTTDLVMRLSGGMLPSNSVHRSLAASVLGKYPRKQGSASARLGGLRGGRPRKDGQPKRTLESKGYSAEILPPPKVKGIRMHPHVREYLRGLPADAKQVDVVQAAVRQQTGLETK